MNAKLLIGLGLVLALGACVSTPQPSAALVTARSAVQSAEADPNVSKYAALDLEAAKKDLEVAESAALHHRDAEIAQPAYLTTQTARLAQAHASAKADDARVAAGQAERDRIQLAARSREVDNAQAQTNAAKMNANAVKNALLTRGIASTRINTEGYGMAFLVANNADSGGR